MELAGRVRGFGPGARLGGAAALGAACALGQEPLGAWPVFLAAMAVLAGLWHGAPGWRSAAAIGWAAGAGHFALALSWIVEPFLVDASRHGWMAPFALAGMSAGMGLVWAGGFALGRIAGGGWMAFVAAMTLAEGFRTYAFTGFPWAQPGHVWIGTPALHWASLGGSLLLSAIALSAAVGLWLCLNRSWIAGAATAAALAALHLGGAALAPAPGVGADRPVVRLVQPNAPQSEKWDPVLGRIYRERLAAYSAAPAARGARPDLVVWPEAAVSAQHGGLERALAEAAAAAGAPVALGVLREESGRRFNSLAAADGDGRLAGLYDKHHLVPFGEYIPFSGLLKGLVSGGLAAGLGGGYAAGPGPAVIDVPGLGPALPLICYESVFPQDVGGAPRRAEFMLLVTNDAWFGTVSGPHQHLAQARLRSAEQGLPMVRVANTGISAVIDSAGRVTAAIPLGEAGWIDAPLPAAAPPTVYARFGDWPVLLLAAIALLAARRRRRRFPH